MQPVQHRGLLLQPDIALVVVRAEAVRAQRHRVTVLRRRRIVPDHPAEAHEDEVADLDIPPLRLRPDVEPLRLAALVQLVVADPVRRVYVVLDAFLRGVAGPVKKDAAPRDAVLRPVVYRALEVGVRAGNVGALSIVVEGIRREVGELDKSASSQAEVDWGTTHMAESVPLSSALGVHVV